jgi:hypothetical protein
MDFYELQKSSLILENIAAAKALLVKDYAEKQKKNVNEIPEEIKKSIWRDPKYKQILDLAQEGKYYENGELTPTKNPDGTFAPGGEKKLPSNEGWVFPLTKLYVIDGCPWEELVSIDDEGNPTGIYNMLVQLKANLSQLPLGNVDAYGRIKEGNTPSYEVLGDDLRSIQSKRKFKKLYDEFIQRMKVEFRKASESKNPKDKDLIQRLELSAETLEKLKPKKGVDEKTRKVVTLIPFEEWKKATGKKYSDSPDNLKLYPQFKDPAVAFSTLVRDTSDFVDGWGKGITDYVEALEKLGLRAGIFYYKDNYLVMSARTPEAQRAVSGDSKFCINNDSTFWSYGDGSIQVNIINGNVPKANKKYLLGVTIKKDGVVKNCAWKNNTGSDRDFHESGINYAAFLKKLEYSEDLIRSIIDKFDEEVTIKLSLEKFYKDSKGLTPLSLIQSLINIKNGIFSGVVSPEQWDQVSGIVSFIVREERNIPVSDFIKEFKAGGIFTISAWEVFDYVVEGAYTKKDMEEIKGRTLEVITEVENMKKLVDKGKTIGLKDGEMKKLLFLLEYKDELISKMDALIAAK